MIFAPSVVVQSGRPAFCSSSNSFRLRFPGRAPPFALANVRRADIVERISAAIGFPIFHAESRSLSGPSNCSGPSNSTHFPMVARAFTKAPGLNVCNDVKIG